MTWILTAGGAVLIAVSLRDIFHTLWHPGGFGTLARLVFASMWRLLKLGSRGGSATIAGPLGLLATLVLWTLLILVGFALVYLPRLPEEFSFSSSVDVGTTSDLGGALYLSVVSLATLGLGDVTPAAGPMRLLVPFEALLGFLMLTAGISWILQLYPALIRRRSLARQLTSMGRHSAAELIRSAEASVAVQLLEGVRAQLAGVEMDLLQYGESYYFREREPDVSLAAALPQVHRLVEAGLGSQSAEVRGAATMLQDGLDELLGLLRRDFLGGTDEPESTIVAFARDHRGRTG